MPPNERYRPDPSHLRLGPELADPVEPARFPRHTLRFRNDRHAARIGLDDLDDAEWIDHFARFRPLPGNLERPLALRYHGHQFMSYNPWLGDGRGFLFAQVRDPEGRLLDLGTKGSGTTPYSRGGDGRLTLKGGVRELLATELLEARGVPTSKTFSLVETGESLERHDEPSPTRSCVLVRLSHGHVRIGTFQRLHHLRQRAELKRLLEYCAEVYHPDLLKGPDPLEGPDLPSAFLGRVVEVCADTCAAWMVAGFVHGVLNTDNINISGESFDYGPWRFLPTCDPTFTAAYFDHSGLYSFARQPAAIHWNLQQLANCLQDLSSPSRLGRELALFPARFAQALARRTVEALGVASRGEAADQALSQAWWRWLERSRCPFDQAWYDWYGGPAAELRARASPIRYTGAEWAAVAEILEEAWPARPDALADRYFRGGCPEGLVIEEVEELWAAIEARDDWGPLERKVARIRAAGRALRGGEDSQAQGGPISG